MALTQVSKDVLNSSQANITQVGTLVDLTVSGNISSANYNYANGVSITTPIASALATLTSNAAVQAGNIATIFANLSSVSGSIATLTANAGTQSASIATLTSNAAVQAGLIADTNTAITTANTNMKGYVDNINSTLTANAAAQSGQIASKADLSGATFTGNVTAGNVNISPNLATARLSMITTTDTGQLTFNSSLGFRLIDSGTTVLSVDAQGDLGVGTSTPGYRLHVVDTSGYVDAAFQSQVGSYAMISLRNQSSPNYAFWGADNSTGSAFYANSSANACVFGTTTTNNIQFITDFDERVRILGTTGNVGINTTTPTERLHVEGNVKVSSNVKFTGWHIYETGTNLYFAYNGAVKMSLNTSGNLTVSGDIAGFGTP